MTDTYDTERDTPIFQRGSLILLAVFLVLLLLPEGCGGSGEPSTTPISAKSSDARQQGPLKAVTWGIVRVSRKSVQIGTTLPYCEYTKPEPRIERIVQRRRPGRVIITVLVRFPPKKTGPNAGGCLGVRISAVRWVKLGQDPRKLKLFDGKTSPPRRVQDY